MSGSSKPELGPDRKTTPKLEIQLLKIQEATSKARGETGYIDTPEKIIFDKPTRARTYARKNASTSREC